MAAERVVFQWTLVLGLGVGALVMNAMDAPLRIVMPTGSQLAVAERRVRGLLGDIRKNVVSGRMQKAVAAGHAIELAHGESDSCVRLLLYKGAISLYAQEGDADAVERTYAVMTNALRGLRSAVCLNVLESAIRGTQVAETERVAILFDKSISSHRIEELRSRLADDPENVLLRRRMAENLVVVGDWKQALENFAVSGGEYAQVSREELSGKVRDWKRLGDFWWLESADKADLLHEGYRVHARELYAKRPYVEKSEQKMHDR